MTADTRTKAQRVESLLDLINEWGHMPGGGEAVETFAVIEKQLHDIVPDDPAPQPTPTERDLIQWVSDTVGLSLDHERELARRLAALRGGDAGLRELRAWLSDWIAKAKMAVESESPEFRDTIGDYARGSREGLSHVRTVVIGKINELLAAAPDQADAGKVEPARCGKKVALVNDGSVYCDRATGHDGGCGADVLYSVDLDTVKVEPAAPPPADADREARTLGYKSLDHAMAILRTCVAPYSGEQAQKVANALKQWHDKWSAACDCIYPDERTTVSDLLAEVSRLTTERDEARAELNRIAMAPLAQELDRLRDLNARVTDARDNLLDEVARLTAELDRERGMLGRWSSLAVTMWNRADEWNGPSASSHLRSDIKDRIDTLLAARPAKGEGGA